MNGCKKDLRFWLGIGLRTLGTSALLAGAWALYGFLFFNVSELYPLLAMGLLGVFFTLFLSALQQQTGLSPLVLSFSTTRANLFLAVQVQKLFISAIIALCSFLAVYLADIRFLYGLRGFVSLFVLSLFLCGAGEMCGGIQQRNRKAGVWVTIGFFIFWAVVIFLVLWQSGGTFPLWKLEAALWKLDGVLLALTAAFLLISKRLISRCAITR